MKPKKSKKPAKSKLAKKPSKAKLPGKKTKTVKKSARQSKESKVNALLKLLAAVGPCDNCRGRRWVCENHLDQPWEVFPGCNCGAGAPCPKCNPEARMMLQPIEAMTGLAISATGKLTLPTFAPNCQN